jgi:hypothetical protein
MRKGLTPEEARRRAALHAHYIGLASELTASDESAEQKICHDKEPPKNKENINAAENLPPSQPTRQTSDSPAADALVIIFCAIIILGSTTILTLATADTLGHTPIGYAKAILLELGILGLSTFQTKKLTDYLITKIGTAVLVIISLTAVHTGVKNSETISLKAIETNNTALKNLNSERSRLLSLYDDIQPEYVTKRQKVMAEIRDVSRETSKELSKLPTNPDTRAVQRSLWLETAIRVSLMFLNIMFAHILVRKTLAKPQKNRIKELKAS